MPQASEQQSRASYGCTARAIDPFPPPPAPIGAEEQFFAKAVAAGLDCGYLTIPNEQGELITVPCHEARGYKK